MKLVFDFGGVVFRWRPAHLLARVLPQRTPTAAAAGRLALAFFHDGDWPEFDRGALDVAELVERIGRRLDLDPYDVQRVVDAVPDELQPVPETVDLLARLAAAQQPLYYLSNMPRPYAEHLRREHAFLDCFADGIFSSHVQLIKPDPALFRLALQRFGARPADTVFVDDHPANVEAARSLGLHAVLFRDAAQAARELRAFGLPA